MIGPRPLASPPKIFRNSVDFTTAFVPTKSRVGDSSQLKQNFPVRLLPPSCIGGRCRRLREAFEMHIPFPSRSTHCTNDFASSSREIVTGIADCRLPICDCSRRRWWFCFSSFAGQIQPSPLNLYMFAAPRAAAHFFPSRARVFRLD